MYAGIAAAGPGARLSAIGRAIADVADQHRFGLVRSFAGHGIGQVFHAAPLVKHYRNNDDTELVPGAREGPSEGGGASGWCVCPSSRTHVPPLPLRVAGCQE